MLDVVQVVSGGSGFLRRNWIFLMNAQIGRKYLIRKESNGNN
jgi:hypothetical protein